jgi:hypothetical protein
MVASKRPTPGWYPDPMGDPNGLEAERFWDGHAWTVRIRDLVNSERDESTELADDLMRLSPPTVKHETFNSLTGNTPVPVNLRFGTLLKLGGAVLVFGPLTVGFLSFAGGTYEAIIPAFYITLITAPIGVVMLLVGFATDVKRMMKKQLTVHQLLTIGGVIVLFAPPYIGVSSVGSSRIVYPIGFMMVGAGRFIAFVKRQQETRN